jgi:hypothetical protein
MRKTLVLLAICILSCGSGDATTEEGAASPEGEDVARVTKTIDATDLTMAKSLTVDLSRPGSTVRVDLSRGPVDLSRIRVIGRSAGSISAADVVKRAMRRSGATLSSGSFVLRAPTGPGSPGGPSCSSVTQTDCCACGWDTGGGCLAYRCPCFPGTNACGGGVLAP